MMTGHKLLSVCEQELNEILHVCACQVCLAEVEAALVALLRATGDWRTPAQAARRLGVTMQQLTDLANMKEIGNLAIDMVRTWAACPCFLLPVH